MLMFGFIVYQFYSGSIVSSHLKQKPETIKTLKQLGESNMKLAVEDIVYNRDFFNVSREQIALKWDLYGCSVTKRNLHFIKLFSKFVTSSLNNSPNQHIHFKTIFQRTTDPDALRLYRNKIVFFNKTSHTLQSNFLPFELGMDLVESGTFAFHVEDSTAYKIAQETFDEKIICELSEVLMFPPQRMVGIVQKNSTFRELFTYG